MILTEGIASESVLQELHSILRSKYFVNANRVSRFLRFSTEKAIQGQGGLLKEYTIAVEVYGKDESFDPRMDPIVRVEARRLRSKLTEYYENAGRNDAICIHLPVGSYVPVFEKRESPLSSALSTPAGKYSSQKYLGKPAVPNTLAQNKQAYQEYLNAHRYINRWSPGGLRKAIEFFEQTLIEDPDCAAAYSLLADAYLLLAAHGILPSCKIMPKAKAAALKALEIDNSLVGAHTLLALVNAHYDWNWVEAEKEYRYALRLNPGYAGGHQWYSWCLAMAGRSGEAIREGRQSLESDPDSTMRNTNLGWLFYLARDFTRAREQYHKAIALDPNFFWPYLRLGTAYAAESLLDEAIEALEKAKSLSSESPVSLGILGYCYGLLGKEEAARKLLIRLKKLSQVRYVSSLHIAYIHIGLGDADRAFQRLQKAIAERHPYVGILKTAPIFDRLRSDRRFTGLLKQVNL